MFDVSLMANTAFVSKEIFYTFYLNLNMIKNPSVAIILDFILSIAHLSLYPID